MIIGISILLTLSICINIYLFRTLRKTQNLVIDMLSKQLTDQLTQLMVQKERLAADYEELNPAILQKKNLH